MNLYLDHGDEFNSKFFAEITLSDIVHYFNIPITEEKKIDEKGVLSRIIASELKTLCVEIQSVMNDSGKILQREKYKDVSSFVKEKLKQHNDNSNAASDFISLLMETFPAFKDTAVFRDHTIFILKKVQLFVADLYRHFHKTNVLCQFGDISKMTVFSDNVLPAVLREVRLLLF
jgi:hypothetical protein